MSRRFRYTGVAAVAVIWSTLTTATLLTGFDVVGEDPVSYLGTGGSGAPLFTIGLLTSAVLLVAFHQFVRSRYAVGPGFSLFMLVGLVGQMVAAFVPIGGDPAVHRIHTTSALVLGVSLPLLMWRFAAGQAPGVWRRLAYRLFFAEVVACAGGLYLSARGVAPVAEILPAAVFHVWVFMVTFSAAADREAPSPSPGRTSRLWERSLRVDGGAAPAGRSAPRPEAQPDAQEVADGSLERLPAGGAR